MRSTIWLAAVCCHVLATAATAGPSDGVVKLGVLNDRSGVLSQDGGIGSEIAAKMAAEEFGNMVAGVPIEIVVGSHQNKTDVGVEIARRWLDIDKVDAIVDINNSAIAFAVQDLTREKKKPMLISSAGSIDLTGIKCSPYSVLWTYNNHAIAAGTARSVMEQGFKKWFFITADYSFGTSLEQEASAVVKQYGGTVVGSVRAPINTQDFSSFLLQAQASGADVIAFANASGNTIESVKQAHEFGITGGKQHLAAMLLSVSDVDSIGFANAQGLFSTVGFYWNQDAKTHEWSERFIARYGWPPSMYQIGVYSVVRHYLKAVDALGTDDADQVMVKMRDMPVDDVFVHGGKIAANGLMMHDMYLTQVKTPAESTGKWDYMKIVRTIPALEAFGDQAESGCPLMKK